MISRVGPTACIVVGGGIMLAAACGGEGAEPRDGAEATESAQFAIVPGRIVLDSDHAALVEGFDWAKQQALGYVFEGDPVGDWYEAALPGREAFCMRDVSHQAVGGLALGLAPHTKNMLRKFARSVSASRDWCGYWEIDRHDRPAPVDYRSDGDFWYNLPANFDVLQTAHRVFEWTGDRAYLEDADFEDFYRRTVLDYVAAWDSDGDGVMQSPQANGIRGIASYYEGAGPHIFTGGDLVAAQYAGYRAYARLLELRGESEEAVRFDAEAERLRRIYNATWWSSELGRFYALVEEDGSFSRFEIPSMQILPMYFGITEPRRAEVLFKRLVAGLNVEESSYLAEVAFQYGHADEGFRYLLAQMDPELGRREYPENPFTAVGTTVRYLAGVNPLASAGLVETRSRLPGPVGWVQLDHVPVFDGEIGVHHVGQVETRLTNESERPLRWRAVFAGSPDRMTVDGAPVVPSRRRPEPGAIESFVILEVPPGQTRVVSTGRPW